MSEKYSSIDRVVGAIPHEDKIAIRKDAEDTFEKQHSGEDEETTRKVEKEKSPEQIEIINAANKITNRIVEHFGLPVVNIPPKNVHIINKEFWSQFKAGDSNATFASITQAICIEDTDILMEFAAVVVHEMLHFKSHGALQVTTGEEVDEYRSGFTMKSRDGEKLYFTWLLT